MKNLRKEQCVNICPSNAMFVVPTDTVASRQFSVCGWSDIRSCELSLDGLAAKAVDDLLRNSDRNCMPLLAVLISKVLQSRVVDSKLPKSLMVWSRFPMH